MAVKLNGKNQASEQAIKQKPKPIKMTKQDIAEWDELYEYVRKNVFRYDENQSLSPKMVQRLKGMLKGKAFANRNTRDMANYSYNVVLNTFKFSIIDINNALIRISFDNEFSKMNYLFRIVENNLNTVHNRMRNAVKVKEKAKRMNMDVATHTGAEYQTKAKKESNRLSDLW